MSTQTERAGTSATKAKNKYNAKAYDNFLVVVPKGQKNEIDAKAKELGYKSRDIRNLRMQMKEMLLMWKNNNSYFKVAPVQLHRNEEKMNTIKYNDLKEIDALKTNLLDNGYINLPKKYNREIFRMISHDGSIKYSARKCIDFVTGNSAYEVKRYILN